MNIVNSNNLSQLFFRVDVECLKLSTWFLAPKVVARGTGKVWKRVAEAACDIMSSIPLAADTARISEFAFSRRDRSGSARYRYETDYVAREDVKPLSVADACDRLQRIDSADLASVFVWLDARLGVEGISTDLERRWTPLIELSAHEANGRVCLSVSSAVHSLFQADNRAEMFLIWLLSDANANKGKCVVDERTDWPQLEDGIVRAKGNLLAASAHLASVKVSDVDSDFYRQCSFALSEDADPIVEENTVLSVKNREIIQIDRWPEMFRWISAREN